MVYGFVSSMESIAQQQHEEFNHLWSVQTISFLHDVPSVMHPLKDSKKIYVQGAAADRWYPLRDAERECLLMKAVLGGHKRPRSFPSFHRSPRVQGTVNFFPVLPRHPRCSTVPFLMPSADICLWALSRLLDIFDSCHRLLPSSSHAVCHRTCSQDVRCRCVHTVSDCGVCSRCRLRTARVGNI